MPADELIAEIAEVFANVRLGHGVSLHQARALDDYESPDVVAAQRKLDSEEHWQDIPDAKIDAFADTFRSLRTCSRWTRRSTRASLTRTQGIRFLQHVAMEKNGHQDAAVAERALESYWRAFLAE